MMDKKFETLAIQTSGIKPSQYKENSIPIYITSGYKFLDSETSSALFKEEIEGFVYSRIAQPNALEFEKKMCVLEKMDKACATCTGMAATFTALAAILESGDHIIACRSIFTSTNMLIDKILPKWNIDYTYVDISNPQSWESEINSRSKVLFLETPSNPGLDLVDLELASRLAKANNMLLVVDNTLASPYLQRPAEFGADIVVHSATKIIDGQGRSMGGIILCKNDLFPSIKFISETIGPTISPFNAWILSKSLETLAVRLEHQCNSALALAKRLEQHKAIRVVKYPFLSSHPNYPIAVKQMLHGGSMVSFELATSLENTIKFVDNLKIIAIAANLGDSRTLITHPFLTTHSKLTTEERKLAHISDNLLRLSVGLENIEDLWQDIDQAIKAALN